VSFGSLLTKVVATSHFMTRRPGYGIDLLNVPTIGVHDRRNNAKERIIVVIVLYS
jgi:hypothetical protein